MSFRRSTVNLFIIVFVLTVETGFGERSGKQGGSRRKRAGLPEEQREGSEHKSTTDIRSTPYGRTSVLTPGPPYTLFRVPSSTPRVNDRSTSPKVITWLTNPGTDVYTGMSGLVTSADHTGKPSLALPLGLGLGLGLLLLIIITIIIILVVCFVCRRERSKKMNSEDEPRETDSISPYATSSTLDTPTSLKHSSTLDTPYLKHSSTLDTPTSLKHPDTNSVVYAEVGVTSGDPLRPSASLNEPPPSYKSSVNSTGGDTVDCSTASMVAVNPMEGDPVDCATINNVAANPKGGSSVDYYTTNIAVVNPMIGAPVDYYTANNAAVNRSSGGTTDYSTPHDYTTECDPTTTSTNVENDVAHGDVTATTETTVIVDNNLNEMTPEGSLTASGNSKDITGHSANRVGDAPAHGEQDQVSHTSVIVDNSLYETMRDETTVELVDREGLDDGLGSRL